MLNNRFNDLVVLLLRRTEVRPCQILELRHDSTVHNLAICVLLSQLEPPLDQVGHEAFHGDEENLFIAVKWNTLHRLILPHLLRPVLVALHLRVFL